MTRIDNNLKTRIRLANDYVKSKTFLVDRALQKLDDVQNELATEGFTTANINAYKQRIRQKGLDELMKGIQMYQWILATDQLNQSLPTAFTDAEVDTENEEIRTHEEE